MPDKTEAHLAADDAPPATAKEPVGCRLKAIREQRHLSIENFVAFSALPQSLVEAFERGEYSKVGIDTFVLGYIRKYASWLDVDVDSYIGDYHREPNAHKRVKADQANHTTPVYVSKSQSKLTHTYSRPKRKAWNAKVIALIVLVFSCSLLLLILLFSNGRLNLISDADDRTGSDTVGGSLNSSLDGAFDSTLNSTLNLEGIGSLTATQADSSESSRESTAPIKPSAGALNDLQEVSVSTDTITIPQIQPQIQAQTQTDIETALSPSTDVPNNSAIDANSSAGEDVLSQPLASVSGSNNSDRDSLKFTFTEDCWLEISSNDQILFAGLKRAGETHTQQGNAPFSVMLGNVKAVSLLLNNQPYNIKSIAGRDTLRFTITPP